MFPQTFFLDNQPKILGAYGRSLQLNITYSQYLSDLSDGWHNLRRRNDPEIQSESPINRRARIAVCMHSILL
jgi:hypothetical protein